MLKALITRPTACPSVTWYDRMADKWRSSATQRIIRLPQSSPDSEVQMHKTRSHKGTKEQTKGTKKTITFFFVPSWTALCLCVKPLLASLSSCPSSLYFAQKTERGSVPSGSF